MENFRPEDLHDYPPRITCRFYSEGNAPERATYSMCLTGLEPKVEFRIPLEVPKLKVAVMDMSKLQVHIIDVVLLQLEL